MVLKEFRIAHSTLIEHYQFIESHLEGIYAAVSDKPFCIGLKEIERDSLGGVIREIKDIEKEKGINILSEDEYKQLRQIVERRNFWCHSCYYELSFDLKTGGPAKVSDIQALFEDMKTAEHWREQLFRKKINLLEKRRMEHEKDTDCSRHAK